MKKINIFYIATLIIIIILTTGITYLNSTVIQGLYVGYNVYVEDEYAYVTHNDGVEIINLQNPKSPNVEGTISISDGAFDCVKNEDILYIAGDSNGLVIANVSNPKNPIKFGETSLDNSASAIGIAYNNFIVYLISTTNIIEIYNVSDPALPLLIKSYSTHFGIDYRDIFFDNNVVFIADGSRGSVEIIDVSDPYNPDLINAISVPSALTLFKYENYLFVGCHSYGIRIFDVSNLSFPRPLASYQESDGEAYGVWGNNTHLYVADLQKGTFLLDISNIDNINKLAHYYNAAPHDVHGNGNLVCLGDQDKRIFTFDLDLFPLYEGHEPKIGYELPLVLNIGVLGIYLYQNVWNNPIQEERIKSINDRTERTKLYQKWTKTK